MKVKDLIADSIWLPNAGVDRSETPAVSILMPTYCRGRDGLFRRAVRSVLDQVLHDIELIIVDDGSVDGTAAEIDRFMADDPRVHCVRHPVNVGLPAISMFEAFQHARADYIGFAFDDDVATHDGLARLVEHAVAHASLCVHGYSLYGNATEVVDAPSRLIELGRRDASGHYPVPPEWLPPPGFDGNQAQGLWKLHTLNLLGNMSVLVHRHVFDLVGLYDPHVIMVRSCDWDLWKRVAAHVEIDYCDVQVSIENGDLRPDSLGSTYSLDLQRVVDYTLLPRDARLVPSRFAEFDVTAIPEGADVRLVAYAERMRQEVQDRGRLRQLTTTAAPRKQVVLLYDQGPATHLLVHALPAELRGQFYVHHGRTDWDAMWPIFVNASAVVVCRDADRFARLGIGAEIRELDVPFYFYPADGTIPSNLAELLPNLRGLVLATDTSREQARGLELDDHVIDWPLTAEEHALDTAAVSPPTADRTIVGIVGGHDGIASALSALAIELVPVPDDMSWPQMVAKWRRRGIQVLLIGSGTPFDGQAAVLLACLIGAVPVALDAKQELATLLAALQDPTERATVYERAILHCRTHFSAEQAARAARQLLREVAPVDVLSAEERWRRMERLRTSTIVAQHQQLLRSQARCRELEQVIEDLKRVR